MKATRMSLIAALIAAGLVAYSPAARAQDDAKAKDSKPAAKREVRPGRPGGPGGPEAAKERFNKMAEELKLTDEQKPKVETAMKDQMEKIRPIFQDSSLSQDQKREKAKALREEMSKKMKEILTAEQFAKWEKMPMGRGQGRPGGPGGDSKATGEKPEKN